MANEQNLLKPEDLTPKQRRENASKAGKASGEARRKKKLLRECLEILLEKEMTDKKGETMTGAEALSAKLFKEAMKGNVKAFEVLRDTAGQKPVEKVQMNADINIAESAERLSNMFEQIKNE
jgi:hypothetical protein